MTKMTKLKPCPFCGEEKKIVIIKNGAGWKSGVECNNCELDIYFFKDGVNIGHTSKGSVKDIVKAWNKRTPVLKGKMAKEIKKPKTQKISNSCLPCMVVGGDCCGVLYWGDGGRVLCNECGKEFNVALKG